MWQQQLGLCVTEEIEKVRHNNSYKCISTQCQWRWKILQVEGGLLNDECMCKHAESRGVLACPPRIFFAIRGSNIASETIFLAKNEQNK